MQDWELLRLYHSLNGGITWNLSRRTAEFDCYRSAVEFANAAPTWRVRCARREVCLIAGVLS